MNDLSQQSNAALPPLAPAIPESRPGFRLASRMLYIFLDVLEVLLLLRVGCKLFNANQVVVIVRLIYSVTDVFVAPFREFFFAAGSDDLILEFGTLAAMVFYAVAVYLLVEFLLYMGKRK